MPSNIFQRLSVLLKDKQKKTFFYKYFQEDTEKAFLYKVESEAEGIMPEIHHESKDSEFMTVPLDEIAKKIQQEQQDTQQETSQGSDIFSSFGAGIREISFEDSQSEN